MTTDASSGRPEPYQTDTDISRRKVRHCSIFGFCAYPDDDGRSGRRTFIVNEGNTMFWRDTAGKPLLEWPADRELAPPYHSPN